MAAPAPNQPTPLKAREERFEETTSLPSLIAVN